MVTLTRIYTRGGDAGNLARPRRRVAKHDPRVEAYGTTDEANSVIGLARSAIARTLLGGELVAKPTPCWPHPERPVRSRRRPLHARGREQARRAGVAHRASQVERLEQEIDAMNADLEPLNSFILPGGSEAAAWLHLARTVVRRAERRMTRSPPNSRSTPRRSSTSTACPITCSCWRGG